MSKTNDGRDRRPIFAVQIVWSSSYALTKTPKWKGTISSSSFYGQMTDYYSHTFSLIHPVDEFSFKEVRTWKQYKVLSCCIVYIAHAKILGWGGEHLTIQQASDFQSRIFSLAYPMDELSFKEIKTWGQSKITYLIVFIFGVNKEKQEGGEFQDSSVQPMWWKFSLQTELHSEFHQTSTTELLFENNQWLQQVNCSRKKATPQTSDWSLIESTSILKIVDLGMIYCLN